MRAVEYLSINVKRVQILNIKNIVKDVDTRSKGLCEFCQFVKIKNQISHCFHIQSKLLF